MLMPISSGIRDGEFMFMSDPGDIDNCNDGRYQLFNFFPIVQGKIYNLIIVCALRFHLDLEVHLWTKRCTESK